MFQTEVVTTIKTHFMFNVFFSFSFFLSKIAQFMR